MRFLPKSLTDQLLLILLLALFTAQGVSLFLFADERLEAIRKVQRQNVAVRTAGLVKLIADAPRELQQRVVKTASSPSLRFTLRDEKPQIRRPYVGKRSQRVQSILAETLEIPRDRILISRHHPESRWSGGRKFWDKFDDDAEDHDDDDWEHDHHWHGKWLSIAVQLDDGRWLSAMTGPPPGAPRWGKWFLLSLLLTGGAVAGVAIIAGRRFGRPMRDLARAADLLGRGEPVQVIDEAGPRETRQTIRAFNQMRERLDRFLRDRTAMLAAISHDLKTPITSLRLRAEFIEDADMREKILATLDEMQAMTESTLDFIREDAARDPGRSTDVSALVESVVADFADTGRAAEFTGGVEATCVCRPTSLRRALRNIIDNAIAYGEEARVFLEKDDDEIRIVIEDNGPGIAAEDLDRVFDPFIRLEASRSRSTGGVGLGLAIGRTIARGHGGDLNLSNRPEGGLRVVLSLPVEA